MKKLAIVGTATSSVHLAPYNNPDYEIWGLNGVYSLVDYPNITNFTRWFEVHLMKDIEALSNDTKHAYGMDYMDWLQKSTIPVYMVDRFEEVPMSVKYPLGEILNRFPRAYFNNTISWMIALAIYEGYTDISVFGVDMATNSEYCVAPTTKVLNANLEYVNAGELIIGQEIVGFDEEPTSLSMDRKYRIANVESANRIIRPCYKLTLSDDTEIICSKEHKWLVGGPQNHWLETEKLVAKGDYVDNRCSHICKPLSYWETDLSYDAGYLAAALDGEGSLSQCPRRVGDSHTLVMTFSQKENEMSRKFEEAMQERGLLFGKRVAEDCIKYGISSRKQVTKVLGSIRPPRLLSKMDVSKLGMMRTTDKVGVVKKEFLGDREVIALKTSTGTFIAEGLASHNCNQRPSCEYFLGYAEGAGIKIYIPNESDLLKTPFLYGFEDEKQNFMRVKLLAKKAEYEKKKAESKMQADQANAALNTYDGALQDCEYMLGVWF